MKKVAILANGGDVAGFNAVIRGIVKPAENKGIEAYGIIDGYNGLLKNEYIKLRNKSNISQSELARRVGIARSTVARMEKNLHSISLGTFTKLLEAMNYKLEITKKEENINESR